MDAINIQNNQVNHYNKYSIVSKSDKPLEYSQAESKTGESDKAKEGDEVSLSNVSSEMRLRALIIEKTLTAAEEYASSSIDQDLFIQAGKEEYLESISTATDTSPEATAGRIVGGITGYIFGAFKLQNPDYTEEQLKDFQSQVMGGFEKGLSEAREIITALSAMDEGLSQSIDKTASIVREQLEKFFEDRFNEFKQPDAQVNTEE